MVKSFDLISNGLGISLNSLEFLRLGHRHISEPIGTQKFWMIIGQLSRSSIWQLNCHSELWAPNRILSKYKFTIRLFSWLHILEILILQIYLYDFLSYMRELCLFKIDDRNRQSWFFPYLPKLSIAIWSDLTPH